MSPSDRPQCEHVVSATVEAVGGRLEDELRTRSDWRLDQVDHLAGTIDAHFGSYTGWLSVHLSLSAAGDGGTRVRAELEPVDGAALALSGVRELLAGLDA